MAAAIRSSAGSAKVASAMAKVEPGMAMAVAVAAAVGARVAAAGMAVEHTEAAAAATTAWMVAATAAMACRRCRPHTTPWRRRQHRASPPYPSRWHGSRARATWRASRTCMHAIRGNQRQSEAIRGNQRQSATWRASRTARGRRGSTPARSRLRDVTSR